MGDLMCSELINGRNIAMYRVFPQHLLDLSPILDRMVLHVSRAMEAAIDYAILQKLD